VLPEGVARYQHALFGLEKHEGDWIMARSAVNLPISRAQAQGHPGRQGLVHGKPIAPLPCRLEGEFCLVPGFRRGKGVLRNGDPALPPGVQRGVATAVVRVKMSVDDPRKGLRTQARGDEGHCLLGVARIAGVDECGAFTAREKNVVR